MIDLIAHATRKTTTEITIILKMRTIVPPIAEIVPFFLNIVKRVHKL